MFSEADQLLHSPISRSLFSTLSLNLMEYHFLSLPLLFTFIFLVLQIRKKSKTNGFTNLPPGPLKLPLIGNLHNLIGSLPHHRLRDLAAKYGPVMHLQLGEISAIVASTPETAETVMKTHDGIFAQRPRVLGPHITSYGSKDIAFSHGNYWRQLRKICTTELLSPKRVKTFQSIREEEVGNLINSISSSAGLPVNLSREIFSSSYGVTGRSAFGEKCKQQDEFIAFVEESTKLAAGFSPADVFPSFKLLQIVSGFRTKIERLHRQCDRVLNSIISEHVANKKASLEAKGQADNLLGVLLDLQENGDLEFPLTTDSIKAVMMDILSAGSETSASIVEWAMAEMLKNPRIMEKAQEEVRKAFATKGIVNEASLEELTFLKCVIKETLRLHPPAPLLLPRECQEQCKINGYDIPLKTKVIVNAWAIGRDPRYWTEPDRFYPERFLDNPIEFKGTDFEYVPFGAGRRICPGISFAQPNMELPLANFLYHFDWKLANGVKSEDLDMSEAFGASVRRQADLFLIAIPYHSQ